MASAAPKPSCISTTPTTARKATAPPTCITSGTFYDYRWSTTLARRDKINKHATVEKASGPDGNGGLINVAGDYRELQSSMWAHDHRFFFTAENVYKGNFMAVNYYSGPDRGNEKLTDGINLKLPSGSLLDWGNVDFDVNLVVHDYATAADGQCFFDIFTTDGFLGDLLCVNMAYAPSWRYCPGSIASASSTPACRASSSWRCRGTGRRCPSSSSPTTATWSSTRSIC